MSLNLSLEPAKRRGLYYRVSARVSAPFHFINDKRLAARVLAVWRFVNDRRLAPRAVAIMVIAAMLMPAVYFGGVRTASARFVALSGESAPVSAPPEPFQVSSSEFRVPSLLALGGSSWQSLIDFASSTKPEGLELTNLQSAFRNPQSAAASVFDLGFAILSLGLNRPTEVVPANPQSAFRNPQSAIHDGSGKSAIRIPQSAIHDGSGKSAIRIPKSAIGPASAAIGNRDLRF